MGVAVPPSPSRTHHKGPVTGGEPGWALCTVFCRNADHQVMPLPVPDAAFPANAPPPEIKPSEREASVAHKVGKTLASE